MMRTKLTLVAASLATLMMTSAHAAPPAEADLSISANVVPSACTFDVTDNGIFDYGDISKATLSRDNYNVLPEKQVNYAVVCTANQRFYLTIVDNRTGTAAVNDPAHFGLGLANNGAKIGYNTYKFLQTGVVVEGMTNAAVTWSDIADMYWVETHPKTPVMADMSRKYGWTPVSQGDGNQTLSPQAVKTASGVLEAQATIAPIMYLPQTEEINLDGYATFELNYI